MPILPNNSKGAFREIKKAIKARIEEIPLIGQVWGRMRYADSLDDWIDIAAITIGEEDVLRVCFVSLDDFVTSKKQNRQTLIKATFQVELIHQFREGSDESNSTDDFEDALGDLNDKFKQEEALGFTDVTSSEVINSTLQGGGGEGGATPVYVDGILAHRKLFTIDVDFRIC